MAYQFLRGDTAANDAYTGPAGSFTFDTQANNIRAHDGVTAGGLVLETLGHLQDLLDDKADLAGADFQTMPLVGGDAIISSGSNGNGSWTMFSNGFMHVSTEFTGVDVDVATGSVLTSGSAGSSTWTYPQAFISQPLYGSCTGESASVWGNIFLEGAATSSWRAFAATSQTNQTFKLSASGFWK